MRTESDSEWLASIADPNRYGLTGDGRERIRAIAAKLAEHETVNQAPDFCECDACRAKPGSPVLCSGCRANRAELVRLNHVRVGLLARVRVLEHEVARLRDVPPLGLASPTETNDGRYCRER